MNTLVETDNVTFTGPGTSLFAYTVNAYFDPNVITLEQYSYGGYPSGAFVGFKISDLTNPSAFANWKVVGAPTPFNSYESGGSFYINWQGVGPISSGQQLLIAPGPVPGAGLAGLAALALAGLHTRKRRA